jgi:uncharacterized protein YjgD (DUF1641 family)
MTILVEHPTLEERLDRLTAQVEYLVEKAERDELRRMNLGELGHDLGPIATQAMSSASAKLEEVDISLEDLGHFLTVMATALPTLEKAMLQLTSISELAGDASDLAAPAMHSLTERLGELERRGYFDFARSSLGIVDRIVTSYSEEDVEALGENVVLILDTVRQMTQPEVMSMLRRTLDTVGVAEGPAEPPSLFRLLRAMRQPETRRGLARVLNMLRSVGDSSPSDA